MRRLAFLSACTVALIAGCGGGEHEPPAGRSVVTGTFVGTAGNAHVAVVAGAGEAVAMVSDGEEGIAEPFGGERPGDEIELESRNGARLDVRLSEQRGSGTLLLAGEEHQLTLARADERAGLYRAAGRVGDDPVWAVWVVLNDGSQRSAASNGRDVAEAPALDVETQRIAVGAEETEVAKVEPDIAGGAGEDSPAARGVFEGGSGFEGGVEQFGGFNQFRAEGGFNFGGSFSTRLSGGFGGFGASISP